MEYISVTKLVTNTENPRDIKEKEYERLKESIQGERGKDFFEARPIITSNRTGKNVIIAGNCRYRASIELGWQNVPCVIMEGLTKKQEDEIIVRDNVSNGEWDWDVLANCWEENDLEEWGLEIPKLSTVDDEKEVEKETKKQKELKLSFPSVEEKENFLEEIFDAMMKYRGKEL